MNERGKNGRKRVKKKRREREREKKKRRGRRVRGSRERKMACAKSDENWTTRARGVVERVYLFEDGRSTDGCAYIRVTGSGGYMIVCTVGYMVAWLYIGRPEAHAGQRGVTRPTQRRKENAKRSIEVA